MKKRHVTELTGKELSAAFEAAVSEAWTAASEQGVDVYGRSEHSNLKALSVRKPDGSIHQVQEKKLGSAVSRKSAAA